MENGKQKRDAEERLRDRIRELDLGDGITASMGVGKPTYHFSNRLPSLRKDNGTTIAVEFSSTEDENKELLHFLLQRTRS